MSKALVVFSGGQDSTTCLGWALEYYAEVSCITFHYGQRHAVEIDAAARVVAFFEQMYGRTIPHEIVDVPDILHSASPLTDKAGKLETYSDHASMSAIIGDRVEKTFVPMRNTLFLTIAANRAVAAGIDTLVTGVCQEDGANYPDCTDNFITCLSEAFDASLGRPNPADYAVRIATPLMGRSKASTVRLALDTPHTYAALSFSHTAYDGQYPPTGRDHASVLRAHGFERADVPDPLVLRAVHEGRMPMPLTHNYRPELAEGLTDSMKRFWA
jgi:7-cyano-7-deazaguanine synthase